MTNLDFKVIVDTGFDEALGWCLHQFGFDNTGAVWSWAWDQKSGGVTVVFKFRSMDDATDFKLRFG